jgi:hypothetical protein
MTHRKFVDLPIQNGDFPVRYVSLPEANRLLGMMLELSQAAAQHGLNLRNQLLFPINLAGNLENCHAPR